MIYFFYLTIGLCLIIIETTIIPLFPIFNRFYDLLIPLIIFLAAHKPINNGLFIIIGLGIIMDILSGGAFGIFSITYLWLFIFVRWITVFLHAHSTILLILIVAAGTIIENLFFLITIVINNNILIPIDILKTFIGNILWAIITGPFILVTLEIINRNFNSQFIKDDKIYG